jgi:hypothetical protein
MLPLVLLGSGVGFAAPAVVLEGPAASISAGASAAFSLEGGGTGLLVDGCGVVELERKEGDRWVVAASLEVCRGTEPARRVDSKLTLSVQPPGEGQYRGVVGWGRGCAEGRPFALATCSELGTARSAPFMVLGPASQR